MQKSTNYGILLKGDILKYSIQYWDKKYDNILYFFQRLEEMLFHYSDDIVRTPIHNTRTLIEEYLKNEAKMQQGEVGAYQIEQILDELSHSVEQDKILHKNLSDKTTLMIAESIKKEKKPAIIYLKSKIPKRTYYDWCIKYLNENIFEPNHKKGIEFAARTWIVEVISYGYTPEYIYKHVQAVMKNKTLNPKELFTNFIESFSFSQKEFRVYFVFSSAITPYKTLFQQRIGVTFEDDGNFYKIKKRKNDCIGYIDNKSLDRYKATYRANDYVDTFIRYYKVISNRRNELVRPNVMVNQKNSKSFYFLERKSFGYRAYEPEPKFNLQELVDNIILNCQKKPKDTYLHLNKIVNLHNEAISQQDLNDGFLNFWSILEVISSSIECESKIEKVIYGITPILKKDFFTATLENIDQDLHDNLNDKDYENLIMQTYSKETHEINYIGRFIFLPEFEKLREEYFEKLSQFPVIRAKIYRLWELRESKSQLLNFCNKYEQRIKWHLYRLYRTRNAIVHSGESHIRIQSLGEHLHIYVDRIITELLIKLSSEETLQSISDVLIDTKYLMSLMLKNFEENSAVEDEDLKLLSQGFFYVSDEKI